MSDNLAMAGTSDTQERERQKPTLFLASTNESLDWAVAAQIEIGDIAEIVRWDQGGFPSGWTNLQSLIYITSSYDFAVFISGGEDQVISRGQQSAGVRDNILFEYGLFIGKLGIERTFTSLTLLNNLKSRATLLDIPA